jgi:hypothetical protein
MSNSSGAASGVHAAQWTWKTTAALVITACAVSVGLVLGFRPAVGYTRWSATVPRYTVLAGDHMLVVTVRAENTGTMAAGAMCQVAAWFPKLNTWIWDGDVGVIDHDVSPHHYGTAVARFPVHGVLAGDATALYALCS